MKKFITLTDQELVQLFIDGESQALEVLINRHKSRIFTSLYLLIQDKYLAEDIFQELFIKIIETLRAGKYKEENRFVQWAMRIGHNLCIDHFRKIKGKPVIRTSEGMDIFDTLSFADSNV
ncbi:MAG TPA: sigma factor, partial [Ferruginibacter sp.]|nr:sigma factor [Ferruginibacter sp.]